MNTTLGNTTRHVNVDLGQNRKLSKQYSLNASWNITIGKWKLYVMKVLK